MALQPIVFFGSSPFSIIVLNRILNTEHRISAVITTEDKPVGRHLKLTPNPVKVLAEKNNIPVYTSLLSFPSPMSNGVRDEKLEKFLDVGEGAGGEVLGLVAAYGQIIKPEVLDQFHGQIYNIHPSLLPKYRGPSPLQQQILDGVTDTGVTIIQLDAQMDHGPIVAVAHDNILPDDTTQTLGNRLFEKGAELFLNTSPLSFPSPMSNEVRDEKFEKFFDVGEGLGVRYTSQDHSQATYTKKLTRQDGFLPWEEFNKLITSHDPTQNHHDPHLSRLFRAYFPWPGVWTLNPQGKRVKLVSLNPLSVL